MTFKSLLSLFVLTVILFTSAVAQTPAPADTSKEEVQKDQRELEKKALALLNEILDSAQLLKLPENRSYVFATAADLLWKYDEKRARIFFQSAMTDLAQAMKDTTLNDTQRYDSLWVTINQRKEILVRVARHDPQFALELLQATRQAFSENSPLYTRIMNQELMLEQQIAGEVAAKDPKRALQLAEESLAKGVSYETLTLLRKLQAKESEAATTFATDVIKKLDTLDFSKSREAFMVAHGLLRMLIEPERASSSTQTDKPAPKSKRVALDDQTIRDLIDIVVTAALNVSTERYDLMMLQPLLPELEKRVPERVAQIRKKLSENNEKLDPTIKLMMQYQLLMTDGKPDAILEAAAKAPPDMSSLLYQSALTKLMISGDLEGARKVAVDHMPGPNGERWLGIIDQRLITRALEQEKMDDARKLIARITPNEARLAQIASLATRMFAKGDRKMALALLDETRQLVDRSPENQQELNAMLNVAKAYAVIEPSRAYGIFEPVIDQANSLLAAAAVLAKFGADQSYFKDGEFRMQTTMDYSWRLSSQFGKELAALAGLDFARTRALADRFLRDEVRMMARILLVQAILTPRPEKDTKGVSDDLDDG